MVLYKDFHFFHQSLLNLIDRQHGTQITYMELRGVVESWIKRRFDLLRHQNSKCRSGLENCRLLATLPGQNVENLDDFGCPKVQDLVKTDSS